jgi:hypothetical protein
VAAAWVTVGPGTALIWPLVAVFFFARKWGEVQTRVEMG